MVSTSPSPGTEEDKGEKPSWHEFVNGFFSLIKKTDKENVASYYVSRVKKLAKNERRRLDKYLMKNEKFFNLGIFENLNEKEMFLKAERLVIENLVETTNAEDTINDIAKENSPDNPYTLYETKSPKGKEILAKIIGPGGGMNQMVAETVYPYISVMREAVLGPEQQTHVFERVFRKDKCNISIDDIEKSYEKLKLDGDFRGEFEQN